MRLNQAAKEALEFFFSRTNVTDPDRYLFISYRTGRPLEPVRSWMLIQEWTKAVGLIKEHYGTHSLRKTWGYMARRAGVPIELIQEKFAHSSPAITRRYIGITQQEVSDVEASICL